MAQKAPIRPPAPSLKEFLDEEFSKSIQKYTGLWKELERCEATTKQMTNGFDSLLSREVARIKEDACKYWGQIYVEHEMHGSSDFTYVKLRERVLEEAAKKPGPTLVK